MVVVKEEPLDEEGESCQQRVSERDREASLKLWEWKGRWLPVGFQWPCIAQTRATLANNLSLEGTEKVSEASLSLTKTEQPKAHSSVGTENVFFGGKRQVILV